MKTPRRFNSPRIFRYPCPLNIHAGEADDVRLRDTIVVDVGWTFSSQKKSHLMLIGCQGGEKSAGKRGGTLAPLPKSGKA